MNGSPGLTIRLAGMTSAPEFGADADLAAELATVRAELAAVRAERDRLRAELDAAEESALRWRAAALAGWNEFGQSADSGQVHREIEAMRNTLSWRVTKPLRVARSLIPTVDG